MESSNTPTAYCLKCKSQQSINEPSVKTTKRGNKYIQGKCLLCNCKINKFLKNDISIRVK